MQCTCLYTGLYGICLCVRRQCSLVYEPSQNPVTWHMIFALFCPIDYSLNWRFSQTGPHFDCKVLFPSHDGLKVLWRSAQHSNFGVRRLQKPRKLARNLPWLWSKSRMLYVKWRTKKILLSSSFCTRRACLVFLPSRPVDLQNNAICYLESESSLTNERDNADVNAYVRQSPGAQLLRKLPC